MGLPIQLRQVFTKERGIEIGRNEGSNVEKSLFLIDGNSLINRAFYALPPLTTAAGDPINAVYGLTMMLLRLKEDYSPDQIVVTFDVSGPTFRHEQFDEYKATRKGMPDELRSQIPVMKEVIDLMGLKRVELAGYEADDLIGTAAKRGEAAGYKVFIVTGDRDAFQLISPQTTVLYTRRGITETERMDEENLKKSQGITPKQVQDLKGLMGDSSDNIPGVPGVGEKTALKLLESYGSLEGVYDNIEEIKGKLKERLVEFEKQAFLSRDLATIRCDVPLEIDVGERKEVDYEALRLRFQELGFKTLLDRLPEAEGPLSTKEAWAQDFTSITKANWPQFEKQISGATKVYLTMAADQTLVVCCGEGVWTLGFRLMGEQLEELASILASKHLYCSNSKNLQHVLGRALDPLRVFFDLELALYCLNPEGRWDFQTIASHFQQPTTTAQPDSLEYNIALVQLLAVVAPIIEKELKEHGLWELYGNLELPLAAVLAQMEGEGILVDPDKLKEIASDLEQSLLKLSEVIYREAGEEFNINSPKQLGVILFEKLGLPVIKRTKTGPSTSADVLEELSDQPIVASVLEYRQVAKIKSTYADALGELISPSTKRIHTTFNQTVTATGRLSSTHPNLQNIPVRTAEGRRIREAFVAPPDHYLLGADYSQIELRLLAHLSGDPTLCEAFRTGQDIHAQTAAEIFDLDLNEVTSADRNAAKAINFGIVYGISSFGLAKGINLTRTQAQEYIDSYFLRYPLVKSFLDASVERGRKLGYVETLLKRRRYLPDLKSRNFAARNFAARTAMNSPIQGSAADIIKLAMLNVHAALREAKLRSKLLLQVHDELVFEVPKEELMVVADLVKREMEGVMTLEVPLVVGVFYGLNWRDVEPLEFGGQA